jgi:hypothetical protein
MHHIDTLFVAHWISAAEIEGNTSRVFPHRLSSVSGLWLYTVFFSLPHKCNYTGSDLVSEKVTIPCLLLFHQEHFKQHIELFMVFRKCSQNLYNILVCLCDLRKRNGSNNPCSLTGHHATLMPLVALCGLIGDFLHINTCYSLFHISTEMKTLFITEWNKYGVYFSST